MSHQSGIQASQELLKAFQGAVHNNDVRLIKISIVEESLAPTNVINVAGTWQDDFHYVIEQFEEKKPCYIIYRLDDKNTSGFTWVFFCYVPDNAYVRDKMLYASTRSTLKKSLGDYYFSDEMYGTHANEFNLDGYQKHRKSVTAAPALTEREEEIQRMRKEESGADIGVTTKKAHVHGVHFPFSDSATQALHTLKNQSVNYVQLSIDIDKELIELQHSKDVDASQLSSLTPADTPRYHFFRYKHSFEDNTIEPIIFVYSCPMRSKVKERMLYSSSKVSVLAVAEEIGLVVEKSSEVSDSIEFTESLIHEELHPKKPEEKKIFKKPTKPGRTGTPRSASNSTNLAGDEE